jgi:Protein of unknown function (DUF3293)
MPLSPALLDAYRRTQYLIFVGDLQIELEIDTHSPQLAELLRRESRQSAAVLTAWNPRSEPRSEAENRAAQIDLLRLLKTLPVVSYSGENRARDNAWPIEPSVLVLGVDRATAQALAQRFGQLAFLWSDTSAIPQLMETVMPNQIAAEQAP